MPRKVKVKLGLLRSEHRPTGWTSELEQIIRDNYKTKIAKQIAALSAMVAAGKTLNSVEKQRPHLGLKKRKK